MQGFFFIQIFNCNQSNSFFFQFCLCIFIKSLYNIRSINIQIQVRLIDKVNYQTLFGSVANT